MTEASEGERTGLSIEEANALVEEHRGWAESIARSVARSWNLDWQLDGLDGAAMEALIFCSRRFQPGRGVPFRGYARKRIHEASTEAARKSRGWRRGAQRNDIEHRGREISAALMDVFPELRMGELPYTEEYTGDDAADMRSAVRQLVIGASIIAAKQGSDGESPLPDDLVDYKKMVTLIAELDAVHQAILWETYWEGNSMRTVATNWDIDELSVIREHKAILAHLTKAFATPRGRAMLKLKVRPTLKPMSLKMKKLKQEPQFSRLLRESTAYGEEG